MNFISLEYWLFFFASFGVYYVLRGRRQLGWIVLCSTLFYTIYKPAYLGILVGQLLIDYTAGLGIARSPRYAKAWLLCSIVSNLALLVGFKYLGWLLGLAGVDFPMAEAVPLGLSFHTFQGIAYTTDVYRGQFKAERDFLKFAQYIFFFPQLVAGPIERPSHFIPQIEDKPFRAENFIEGSRLVLWGLVQKMVVADRLALFVDPVFARPSGFSAPAVLVGMLAFTFQILADFSGYTDIARGCARMLGYNLVLNFRNPYGAVSISDFWRRWHISLSSWFRDYVYIPLGGSRQGLLGWMGSSILVFALSGIWHGAQTTFLVWGLFHATLLILERITHAPQRLTRWLTFPLLVVSWVFFRAPSLEAVSQLFSTLFQAEAWASSTSLSEQFAGAGNLYLAAALALTLQAIHAWYAPLSIAVRRHTLPRWALYYLAILLLLFLSPIQNPPFIYFQF